MDSTKSSAKAQSNTALIKYWGKKNEELIIPMNNSISLTIDALSTTTTVEFQSDLKTDQFILNNKEQSGSSLSRVVKHLDYIRKLANESSKALVVSENNFPTAAGLASSASGFAALTVATCSALKLKKTSKELSIITRHGSGSSSRSIFGGYVEWIKGYGDNDSYAEQIKDKTWFDIRDIIVVFKKYERTISTREAMRISMTTSPFYKTRLEQIDDNLKLVRNAIIEKDFTTLGQTAERDCLSMHSVAITSNPAMIFWTGDTLEIIHFVETLREEGLDAYYTIDTGANMHILTLPEFVNEIEERLNNYSNVNNVITAKPGDGVAEIKKHLF